MNRSGRMQTVHAAARMQNKFIVFMVVAGLLLLSLLLPVINPSVAKADQTYFMRIYPEADTYIYQSAPGGNYGWQQYLDAGFWTSMEFPGRLYSLLRFDLNDIPDDATGIHSAYLKMALYAGGGPPLRVERLTSAWDELAVNWVSQPNIWSYPSFFIPNINISYPPPHSSYTWDVTAYVKDWWDGDYANHGLVVMPTRTDEIHKCTFYSKDYTGGKALDRRPYLDISYKGPSPPPEPPEPPEEPTDTEDPQLTLTISPETALQPSDTVTLALTATDDVGLQSMVLDVIGPDHYEHIPWATTEVGVLSHTVSLSDQFGYGTYTVTGSVYDRQAKQAGVSRQFQVMGTARPPVVTLSCQPAEVFPNDNTPIEVTATASDPEGIQSLTVGVGHYGFSNPFSYPDYGQTFTFTAPYPTTVTRTITVDNLDIPGPGRHIFTPVLNATEIVCRARARDGEFLYSNLAEHEIAVIRPYQWDYGLPYLNQQRNSLSWTRMCDTFGRKELRGPGGADWWWTVVARFWRPIYQRMAMMGECFGMSTYSIWHAKHDTPVPNSLSHSGTDDLPPCVTRGTVPYATEQQFTQRAIERWQGSQISDEILSIYIPQIAAELDYDTAGGRATWFINNQLPRLRYDLEHDVPGVLLMAEYRGLSGGAMECVGAHAVVPWHVKDMGDTVCRIYVYDSNRNATSHTPHTDYDNMNHYPYVALSEDGFTWDTGGGEIWNDFIWYIPYEDAVRHDYDLMDGGLVATATLVIMTIGPLLLTTAFTLSHLLPIPLPIPMAAADAQPGDAFQAYALPLDEPCDIYLKGKANGEYAWVSMANHTVYGIANKTTEQNRTDRLSLVVDDGYDGYGIRFRPEVADDAFDVGLAYPGPHGIREYVMENTTMDEDGDIEVYLTGKGGTLVIANRGEDAIATTIVLRSNESSTAARENITVEPRQTARVTDDWSNLGAAPLAVTREAMPDKGFPGFELVAVLAALALALLLWKKRQ